MPLPRIQTCILRAASHHLPLASVSQLCWSDPCKESWRWIEKVKGCWDCVREVRVQQQSHGRTVRYKPTSTVMLWLQTNRSGSGTLNLRGSLTKHMERVKLRNCSPHTTHICTHLVEGVENKIRGMLHAVCVGKTKGIISGLRSVQTLADKPEQEALKDNLVEALQRKQQG